MNILFGAITVLMLNQNVHYEDGLSVSLTSFSHKRPYVGGPTKATAYLLLSKNGVSGEVMLSIHGVAGKSKEEDGLAESQRYEVKHWHDYKFQLKKFDYNESISLVVEKIN